jgi:Trypsin
MRSDGGIAQRAASLLAGVALLMIVSATVPAVALAVVNGKTMPITAAPWTVSVREYGQPRCTGVIIDQSQILTAGHCVMSRNSANPLPASDFTIEAGVSNFKHPLKTDNPQSRSVIAVRVMPGYIAASKETPNNYLALVARDLSILTLSRRLDLHRDGARAVSLPTAGTHPWRDAARFVAAGFGYEHPKGYHQNGTLNEVLSSTPLKRCGTSQVLCVYQTTGICFGDSGSGIVDVQSRPTVVGVASEGQPGCIPGADYYVFLGSPAAQRFIHDSMQTSYLQAMSYGSGDAHTVIRPLPAIGIVCVILGVLGVWKIRRGNERKRR